jgi:hypothetical protein
MVHLLAPRRFASTLRSLVLALGVAACGDEDRTLFACIDTVCPSSDASSASDAGGASLPCEVEFLSPLPSDAGSLELGATDDADARACGESFATNVLLASSASRVNLFVNDNPLGAQPVRGGQVRFEAELGNRGGTSNTLRAEATMADGRRCSADLGTRLFVGCPGPSCSIDTPRANRDGILNQEDDSDSRAAGLQTTLTVATEPENAGQGVRVSIDENLDVVPEAQVTPSDGRGLATFADITLAQGDRVVRAECQDEAGIRTRSPRIAWRVDTASCALRLSQVAGGASPITPADDIDENPENGLDVLVRGNIEGEGCESVQLGPCDAELPAISLNGLLGSDGGFIVPIKLPAVTESIALCGRVKDTSGNVSTPDERLDVEVRTDAPALVIRSPAEGARYNRSGGSGAITDLALDTQATCELDVVVACRDLGVVVELLADGEVQADAPCLEQGGLESPYVGLVTFPSVSLPSRDGGETTALSARQSLPGLPAGVSSSVTVQADCNPPSCNFQSPDPGDPFLSGALDNPNAGGFQTSFVVVSDAESAGQNVRLSIDGNPANNRNATALSGPGGAVATFSDVLLSESAHEIQATCSDPAANLQSTALVSWTVDTTACGVTLSVAGGHNPVVPGDDLDPGEPNLQVPVAGQTTGNGCRAARVGVCTSLDGPFVDLEEDGTFLLAADVPSTAAAGLRICAQVEDDSGNIASASQLIDVRVDAPTVSIDLPSDGDEINADCDAVVVEVQCSEDAAPVELFADDVSQGSVPCALGAANFELDLDSKNDGAATLLSVVQTAQGVPSVPDGIEVFVDCEAPEPSISAPVCNTELALIGDDVRPGVAGLQVDVTVSNDGAPDVTLTVDTGATSTSLQETGDDTSTEFGAVTLVSSGSVSLTACATDAQGNTGCSPPCPFTVVAEPTLTITSPRPPAVLTIDNDCDTLTPGMQARVRGTSNASDGNQVVVTLGSSAPSTVALAAGRYTACVATEDGDDQVLTASITDNVTGLSRTTSVLVSINTSPPPAIAAPTFELIGRREGTVELSWVSVLDSGGDPLAAYHLRCAQSNITTEPDWAAAKVFPLTLSPAGSEGEQETDVISDFRTGTELFCMLRGEDAYGLLGPLGATTLVSNPFLTLEYTGMPANVGTRLSVTALGDINGDGFDDFGYGTQHLGAVVYFGGPDLDVSPDVVITIDSAAASAQANHDLGANVVGLGDINGDDRPDFAVTARALNQPSATAGGSVFIFYGRASSAEWSALAPIQVAPSPGCGADLCLHGTEASATLGSSITSTDFDGDGEADIVIGAQTRTLSATTLVGRVYVVLGGSRLDLPSNSVRLLPTDNPDGFVIDPTTASRNFGINVAAVGLGSDARGDLVISSRGSASVRGEAFSVPGQVYTGPGLEPIVLATAFATGTPNQFGSPMRAVGDVNGDGFGDVWISTNLDLNGILPVFLGRASGFTGVSLLGFTNDVDDNEWGSYVATGFSTELGDVGDIDGNGFDDVLVAGIFAQNNPGTAELFYSGVATGNRLRSAADASYVSTANGYMTPGFVGDIDGDGFRDIAIVESRRTATTPPTPATSLKLLY